MSELLSAIIIAIVQGLTEWLPISSSGHLVLIEKFLNHKQTLAFDVALHFGTLMSVFVYFGKDITDILQDFLKLKFHTENGKLALYLTIATIPAAIAGYFLYNIIDSTLSNLNVLALSFAITGVILIIASLDLKVKPSTLNSKNSFLIGLAQIPALIPAISRSGTTISAALLLGLKEKTALKFSFLMSIPIILGANIYAIGSKTLPPELFWATLASFVVGLITIHLLYKYILTSRKNLLYFGLYALLLALAIGLYLVFLK